MPKTTLVLAGNTPEGYEKQFASLPAHEIIPASVNRFISGEGFVELYFGQGGKYNENKAKLNKSDAVIVHSTNQSGTKSIDEQCMELLRMVGTLKDHKVQHITAVIPFCAFDRQDRDFPGRFTSKAAKHFAKQLKDAGADRIVRITPHSKAAMEFYEEQFGKNVITLSTTKLFADKIRAQYADAGIDLSQLRIGAPDGADKPSDEGQHRAFELARELFGNLPKEQLEKHMFFITKKHIGVNETEIVKEKFRGDVEGKHCIVLDDMIDGGSTTKNAAIFLKGDRHAASITACSTHGILSGNALETILSVKPSQDSAGPAIDKLIVTDTLPTVYGKIKALSPALAQKVEVMSVAPMIAHTLEHLPPLTTGRSANRSA